MLASPKAHYFSGAIAGSRHLREPLGSQLFELAAAGYKDSKTADIYNQGTLIYLAGNYAMPHELRLKAYELLSTFSDKDSEGYSALVAEERQAVADELQPLTTPWEELAGAEFDALLALQGEKGFWDYPSLLGIYRFNQQDNLPEDEPFSAQYVVSELSPRLDKLGLTVWELFIAMLEGWSGSIDELIEVATSTSKK